MVSEPAPPRFAPLAVGVALLVLIVGLAVLPNTGAVTAQSNCQYGVCTNSSPSSSSWLIVLGVLVLIAVALLVLILRGRSKPQASPQAWEPGPSGEAGPGSSAPSSQDVPEGAAVGAALGVGAGSAYVENPDDVSAPDAIAAAPAAAASAGAAAGAEPDIDSLMAELDKISGEILSRGPATKKPPGSGGSDDRSS
ncbi:MAG: hypothetical protein L3K19_01655 [Thermoplasmata archaeon]|nr:hypothetical protein [Thermoplasmata archaeon]